jgi:hypothetical protein
MTVTTEQNVSTTSVFVSPTPMKQNDVLPVKSVVQKQAVPISLTTTKIAASAVMAAVKD